MSLISSEKLSLINSKINIIEIFSKYLKLKKKGHNFWSICPFHNDYHPSMCISPEKKIYHCFSCSASGTVFTFLKEYKNISFLEAVRELAEFANVDCSELNNVKFRKNYSEDEKKLFVINKLAKIYFSNNLNTRKGQKARDYLKYRNIDNKQIEEFMIGYANNDIDDLTNFLLKKGYLINEIVNAGLALISNNKIRDYFNDRIIFPILDIENNIIGFSGRSLSDDEAYVKYLNTPETKIFKKGGLLFNLSRAKSEIRKVNNVILLEGYMDVISLSKITINNTVAIMGVNLSDYNIRIIKKITNECIIFLDSDNPGIKATLNIATRLLKNNFIVKIVINNTQNDPDELINNNKADLVKSMIKNAVHPVTFAINYYQICYDLYDGNDLRLFINLVGNLIKVINNPIEQELYLNKLAVVTNIGKEYLLKQIKLLNNKQHFFLTKQREIRKVINPSFLLEKVSKTAKNKKYKIKNLKQYMLAEKEMILQLLGNRQVLSFYKTKVGFLNFCYYRLLVNEIIGYYNRHLSDESVNISLLYREITDEKLKKILLTVIDNDLQIKIKYSPNALKDLKILINDLAIEREIEFLRIKMNKTKNISEKLILSEKADKMNLQLKFRKKE